MIVECPACNTIFPVDPRKVPTGGIDARCSVCSEVFFVAPPEPEAEVFEPEAEALEPEVEVSGTFVDEEFAETDEIVGEAEPDPILEEGPSSLTASELGEEAEAENEPEPGIVVEEEPAFEIEMDPSFEEREVSFGAEVGATGKELGRRPFLGAPQCRNIRTDNSPLQIARLTSLSSS